MSQSSPNKAFRQRSLRADKLTIETRHVDLDESYTRTHVDVKPGSYLMLAMTDSGDGMPQEVRQHKLTAQDTDSSSDDRCGDARNRRPRAGRAIAIHPPGNVRYNP